MIALLLAGVAWAYPPELDPPEPPPPVPGECAQAHPVHEGDDFPAAMVDGQVAACSGVLMPNSRVAEFLAIESHATMVIRLYKIDTATLQDDVAKLRAEVVRLQKPTPWWRQPWAIAVQGAVIGSAATVLVVSAADR